MLKLALAITAVALLGVPSAIGAPLPILAMGQPSMELDLTTNSLSTGVDFGARNGDLTLFSVEVSSKVDSFLDATAWNEAYEGLDEILIRVVASGIGDLIEGLRKTDIN